MQKRLKNYAVTKLKVEQKQPQLMEKLQFREAVRDSKEKRAYEFANNLYFYWATLLDNPSNLESVLRKEGQCVLIDSPSKVLDGIEKIRFSLCIKESTRIRSIGVKFAVNNLVVCGSTTKLMMIIASYNLRPVKRDFVWQEYQITNNSSLMKNVRYSFENLFEMGDISRKYLSPDCDSLIPILNIAVSDLKPEERNMIILDLENMKNFGCKFIQRLWGCIIYDDHLSVLLEDITIGSLIKYLQLELINEKELIVFCKHIILALEYLGKKGIIHKKLSLDVCLLTDQKTVKVAIFGISTGLLPKKIYLDEVERCRWIPYECLPSTNESPASYDELSMVWTVGTMIWSMFHRAAIPFENEDSEQLKSRSYRRDATLEIIDDFVPSGVQKVIEDCWTERQYRKQISSITEHVKRL